MSVMGPASIIGLFSLLFTIAIPVVAVILLIWVYQIRRSNEIQVEQNEKIIRLLEEKNMQ